MKIRYIDSPDLYWRAEVTLNDVEWPEIDEAGDWLNRPLRQWLMDNLSFLDCSFGCRGRIFFRNLNDVEWFRMVWDSSQNTCANTVDN